jgi:hypothetical protein
MKTATCEHRFNEHSIYGRTKKGEFRVCGRPAITTDPTALCKGCIAILAKNDFDATPDKETGIQRWWLEERIYGQFPALKNPGKFLIGRTKMNGAISGWLIGDTIEYQADVFVPKIGEVAETEMGSLTLWHPRLQAIKLISREMANHWIDVVYSSKQMKAIKEHVEYSVRANKDVKIMDMLKTIERSGILTKEDGTSPTPDEIWNGLPKTFMFELGELHMQAVEALR